MSKIQNHYYNQTSNPQQMLLPSKEEQKIIRKIEKLEKKNQPRNNSLGACYSYLYKQNELDFKISSLWNQYNTLRRRRLGPDLCDNS